MGWGCVWTPGMMTVIHVVDDDPSVGKAISRLLRAAGYDVAVYGSAEQLLDQLLMQRGTGCILLDVVMPGLDGLAARKRLKTIGSSLPIVFMTGSTEPLEDGETDFLRKPVSKEELLDAVERALSAAIEPPTNFR
jgi:FixJ family two-component response regulator